ncbi:MAG: hypothetical protein WBQ50_11420, partial [Nocardioides sp.]
MANLGPGRRRAVKPTRRGQKAAQRTARQVERDAVEAARGHTGGHSGGRKGLIPGLPSAPSLVGAAALALAAVGATMSQPATQLTGNDFDKFGAQASVLNAASSIGSGDALSGRQRAVSRDSQREALQDAA